MVVDEAVVAGGGAVAGLHVEEAVDADGARLVGTTHSLLQSKLQLSFSLGLSVSVDLVLD